MKLEKDLYLQKKILIYGLGVSGMSSLNYLKKNNFIKCFDDNFQNLKSKNLKKCLISKKEIHKTKFDHIIISPGINISKCLLKKYVKKNKSKICTDLDVFYANNSENFIVAITGTNGKSTSAKLLYDILKKNKYDVRLVGNIGNAILNENKISNKTVFVVEISSYQISYSRIFKPNYGVLLNISPDHLERHKTVENYIKTKFKLISSLKKNDFGFINKSDPNQKKFLKNKKFVCKITNVENKISQQDSKLLKNSYFKSSNNLQNLSFILKICSKLRIKKRIIFKVVNNFKALDFRQQIIHNSKRLRIINDSKSTSFSSSIDLLNNLDKIFWILGGLPKKGDKFKHNKKNNISKIYIFGQHSSFFIRNFKKKFEYLKFRNLEEVIKQIRKDIKKEDKNKKINLLFSPCAASFDNFRNFEERGKYFNHLISRYKIKNVR